MIRFLNYPIFRGAQCNISLQKIFKLVSCLLTADQKQARVNATRDSLDHLEIDGKFFDKIIIAEEYIGYNPEKKHQPKQWKSTNLLRPNKARQVKSALKKMSIFFFDVCHIVNLLSNIFKKAKQSIKSFTLVFWGVYCRVFSWSDSISLCSGDWSFHYDNALAYTAVFVHAVLTKNSMTLLPHHPYSSDSTPCELFLFPQMKKY